MEHDGLYRLEELVMVANRTMGEAIDQAIVLLGEGVSEREVARAMGVTVGALRKWVRSRGG